MFILYEKITILLIFAIFAIFLAKLETFFKILLWNLFLIPHSKESFSTVSQNTNFISFFFLTCQAYQNQYSWLFWLSKKFFFTNNIYQIFFLKCMRKMKNFEKKMNKIHHKVTKIEIFSLFFSLNVHIFLKKII